MHASRIAAVFADDVRDGAYLTHTSATGAHWAMDPLEISEWYQVENYVPAEHESVMDSEIQNEADKQRIIPADEWQVEGVAALGIVIKIRKGKTKNRPVWDFSRPEDIGLNARITIPKERFSTVKNAYTLMRPNYWMYKVDLSQAYRSVPLASMYWAKHSFQWKGQQYFDTRLPFGNRAAPGVFHRFTRAIVAKLQSLGHCVVGFIDDFWGVAPTKEEAQRRFDFTIELLSFIGFLVNEEKCNPPAQELDFLGIMLSTAGLHCKAWIEDYKVQELTADINKLLASASSKLNPSRPISRKLLERVMGRLVFASQVVESLTLYMRSGFACMHSSDLTPFRKRMLILSREAKADFSFILRLLHHHNGKRVHLHKRPIKRNYFATDASTSGGMGAVLDERYFAMSWSELATLPQLPFYPQSKHNPSSHHINYLELFAIYWAMTLWGPLLAGRSLTVVIRVDNQAAIGMVRKFWGPSNYIPLLKELQILCLRYDICLQPEYIKSKDNFLADALSRLEYESFYDLRKIWRRQAVASRDDQDWKLVDHLWQSIDEEFGPFTLDACVDPDHANSFCLESWSATEDARKGNFHGFNAWGNPPFRYMLDILRRFLQCKVEHPNGTAACFLIPVWEESATKPVHPAYKLVTGHPTIFHKIRRFEPGEVLFSAPSDFGGGRTIWGGVRWAVEVFRVHPTPLPYNPLI